jgi:D-glycero-alpha-D-manno-heptose-7-phosphate kinase
MVISQAPYRISFAGGGTDLPAFYREESGGVLSVTINKHMYVTVSPRFEPTIRVAYTKVEIANHLDQLQHTIVREALKITRLSEHIEITTIGDVPAGTGLGSSSALAVGLLQALYAFRGEIASPHRLAGEACEIEIERLGKPIGRQDQYASAYGGLNYIRFRMNDTVDVEPVPCTQQTLTRLSNRMMLFYTGQQRSADEILRRQRDGTQQKRETLRAMRDLADSMRQSLTGDGNLDTFGELLHEGWLLKRSLGFGISDPGIDRSYEIARSEGAQGGKLLGAGGGGFLLVMAPEDRHDAIRQALDYPRELPFQIDNRGSRIIFISDRYDP